MAINLDDYMTANPTLSTTEALQACVAMRKPVFIPPTAGWRSIDNPIIFEQFLFIDGEQGNQLTYKDEFDQWQYVEYSNLLANGVMHGRPMFIPGKYVAGNFSGRYADCNGVYRTVYRGAIPSGADTNWASDWTTDPIADLDALNPTLGPDFITIRQMAFSNVDSFGSIINSPYSYNCIFHDSTFGCLNQGVVLNGSFQSSIQNCNFTGGVASWGLMDTAVWARIKAGNGTVDDLAIKANIDYRVSRAFGLYVGGNALVTNNRFVWASGTGLAINGNGCNAHGVYIEKCYKGLVVGNLPSQDILTLSTPPYMLATNKLVSGLPAASSVPLNQKAFVTDSTVAYTTGLGNIVVGGGSNTALVYSDGTNWRIGNNAPLLWGATGGEITSVEMESCWEGVIFGNSNVPVNGMNITGYAANQPDGTFGECLFGVGTRHMIAPYSGINSTVNQGGNEAVRSIGIDGGTPVVINETINDFPRARLVALQSSVDTLETGKATNEAVAVVDNRVTALDDATASLEDLNNVATVVADQYYPTS